MQREGLLQQKKIFTGGMNSDTTDELMPEGMDRYRLNVRVLSSDGDSVGAIETVNGNTLVSLALPSGTNKVIGAFEYAKGNKVYYFVYNSSNNHSIREYDIATNTIATVLQSSLLAFNSSYLITGIDVVELNSTNHLLYWTDNLNEPRKINIEKGKYYTQGNYTLGYKTPFDAAWIRRIKTPPAAPTVAWSNDATRIVNYLFNKNYQFKLQYIHDDNDVSSFSPFSSYVYPTADYVENNCDDDYTHYNTMVITFNSGSSIVKKVKIAAKEMNSTDFVEIVTLDKAEMGFADDTNYTYTFFNDGVYLPIDVRESIKLFDNVPLKSKGQAILPGNRIADSLITEGYDPVTIDLKMTLGFQNVHNSTDPGPLTLGSYLKSGGKYKYGIVYYDHSNRSGVTNVNSGEYDTLQSNGCYGTFLYVPFYTENAYTGAGTDTAPEVTWEIFNSPPSWATHYQILRSKNTAIKKYLQFTAEVVRYYDKNGAEIADPTVTAPFTCDVYYTNMFGTGARYPQEYPQSKLVYDYAVGDRIRFISNAPYVTTPYGGAVPYALPAGTSTTYGAFPDVINLDYNDYEIINSTYHFSNRIITFKMNAQAPLVAGTNLIMPGCLYEIYSPALSQDDDLEIMYEIGECFDISTDSFGHAIHKGLTVDQKIVSATSTSKVGFVLTMAVPTGHGLALTNSVKVIGTNNAWSVYGTVTASAANSVDVTFTGSIFGTYAATASTIVKSAKGIFRSGDSFRPYQNMAWLMNGAVKSGFGGSTVYRRYCVVENMNLNNFTSYKSYDYARPNRIDPDYKQITRPSTIYYSEQFVPETFINGLSTVYDTSFETYEDKYGGIYKLYVEDQRLICFQELKVGALPVNQVIYNDLQGMTTVGAAPEILNTQMMYFAGEFGIGKNPESFAVYGNAKYFFDVRRGTACRLSVDGITPISSVYFLHNNTTDQCEEMLKSTSVVPVFGVYDVKFKEYVIAIPAFSNRDRDNNPAVTLAFNEANNAWTTFYSYKPDYMCGAGMNILSFKAGALYTHNTNTTQNNFYGVQYDSRIHSIMNDNPSNVKVLQAISEECDSVWYVSKVINPMGQESNIISADFEEKEGNQYAPFLRDLNTPNLAAGTALFEGDPLRDRVFEVQLIYDGTAYTKLFAINYLYQLSNRSNK